MSGGYAVALVQTIVALAGVCALAIVLLRLAAARGLGRAPRGRTLELVERLPLDARSSVCVVRAGSKVYLLGVADGVAPSLVAELDADALAPEPTPDAAASKPSFRDLLLNRSSGE